ncbi:MAG: alpha/beta hydrolase, partial [Gammaproteobacteria bacterium]|nr:alpha/beta hydrolase [Gammaproteobacteria bacterium]
LGASVATLVAGTIPERIRSLVCIEGFGPLTTPPEQAPEQLRKSIKRYRDGSGEVRRFGSLAEAARIRARSTSVTLEAATVLSERGTRIDNDQLIWSSDPRLLYDSPMRLTEDHACAFIGSILAPALLIRGDNGIDYLRKVYKRRVAACADLQTRVLPGGHHLHLESDTADRVIEEINSFVGGLV